MKKALFALPLLALVIFMPFISASEGDLKQIIGPNENCGPNDIECPTPKMDVVFVIDSTGSMHDEIRTVKEQLINVIESLESGYPRPDVKIGVVVYRDYPNQEDEYIYKQLDLTNNPYAAVNFIRGIEAQGGGDYEEAVEVGLNVAINKLSWRSNAKKVILLIGDAPPRDRPYYDDNGNWPEDDYQILPMYHGYNYKDAINDANDRQITIYTASGTGMNNRGIGIWKEIARKTGGSYTPLAYTVRDVDRYYEEEAIPMEFLAEAKASRDYDAADNTIITNNIGGFAKSALKQEAESMGVDYDNSFDEITGGATTEYNSIFKEFWTTIKNFFSF